MRRNIFEQIKKLAISEQDRQWQKKSEQDVDKRRSHSFLCLLDSRVSLMIRSISLKTIWEVEGGTSCFLLFISLQMRYIVTCAAILHMKSDQRISGLWNLIVGARYGSSYINSGRWLVALWSVNWEMAWLQASGWITFRLLVLLLGLQVLKDRVLLVFQYLPLWTKRLWMVDGG